MIRQLATIAVLALVLGGCAGQSATFHRYTLPDPSDSSASARPQQATTRVIRVAPVELAQYLASSGIVYQTSDIEVHQAQGHLWAEDLGAQLTRTLRDELGQRLPQIRVVDNGDGDSDSDGVVRVALSRFQGRYDGMAVLAGQFSLRDRQGRLIEQQPFAVEKPLGEDGYPALVRTLGQGWQTVVSRIAGEIRATLPAGNAADSSATPTALSASTGSASGQ